MSGQNLAWKDFRNRMKEKRSGGKLKNLKSCFTLLTEKRFQERWENTNKSSFQKIYICNLRSNTDLASRVSYLHFFYSRGREEEETGEREHIIKKELIVQKLSSEPKPTTMKFPREGPENLSNIIMTKYC